MINQIQENLFQLHLERFRTCTYLIQLDDKNILIDTSCEENRQELINDLKELGLNPKQINIVINTHSHWDHDSNNDLFTDAKIYTGENIDNLDIPGFQIIKTPGHTQDSIAIFYKDILFSGDTLFHEGVGRTDFPESDPKKMQKSLEKLKKLNYEILCPGHI